jgi:hypothetical protein
MRRFVRSTTRAPAPPAVAAHVTPARTHLGRYEAIVRFEAERLVHVLEPFGTLHRDVLEREARSGRWRDGGFVRAVAAAIDNGMIEARPFGFYSLVREGDAGRDALPPRREPREASRRL